VVNALAFGRHQLKVINHKGHEGTRRFYTNHAIPFMAAINVIYSFLMGRMRRHGI